MSIADIVINSIIWVIQKIVLPILPTNILGLPFNTFQETLSGSLKHNFIWGLAGLNQFMNLKLVFILVGIVITGEIIFWSIRSGMFILKIIRG